MRAVLLPLALVATLAALPAAAETKPCDRSCLTGLATRTMAALAAQQPDRVPWAKVVRYSENGVPMMVGDGVWATATRVDRPLIVADPSTGQVAWFGLIEEHGQPGYYAARIRADGDRVAEIESVIRRKQGRPPFAETEGFAHDPRLAAQTPRAAQGERGRLIAVVQGYYNSLARNDGTLFTAFTPDCARVENGQVTTSGDVGPARLATGCEAQVRQALFRDIDGFRGLSFPIVDPDRGLVVVVGERDHSARAEKYVTTDGRPFAPEASYPRSYAFIAVFKIDGNAIARIEEDATEVPYGMLSWKDQDAPQ